MKKKAYSRVISDCEIAIKLNPDYVKAYHRRGKARFCLNDFKGALTDFEIVLKHEPSNSEVNKDLMECRKKVSENSDFKRVCIVEEDDESDEEEN